MNVRRPLLTLTLLLAALPGFAAGDDDDRQKHFIGVFYPSFAGWAIDPQRCPDPSNPLLFRFTGSAQTTLGQAQIEQSHCEGDGRTFVRGEQTMTFADGTQLHGRYEGELLATPTTATDGLLIVSGRTRFTGGTGPFVRAHGKGLSAGTVDTRTGSAVITVRGAL